MKYSDFAELVKAHGYAQNSLPLTATDEDGNAVIIDAHKQDGKTVWETQTAQSNGWVRVNVYYADGTTEELYKK